MEDVSLGIFQARENMIQMMKVEPLLRVHRYCPSLDPQEKHLVLQLELLHLIR